MTWRRPGVSCGILQRLPLWTYRVMPHRWIRWIFREDLARGQEHVERRGWR